MFFCFSFSFLFVGVFGRTDKSIFLFHLLFLFACVTSTEHSMPCAFMACALEMNSNGGLSDSTWNLAL